MVDCKSRSETEDEFQYQLEATKAHQEWLDRFQDTEEPENAIIKISKDPMASKRLQLIEDSETRKRTKFMKPTQKIQAQCALGIDFKAEPTPHRSKKPQTKVFETEDRTRYDNTHEFPQSVHGLVKVKHVGEVYTYGTGTLIGPDLVLTAAHNVWNAYSEKAYPTESIQFYAGLNGKKLPFRLATATKVYIPEIFMKTASQEVPKDDYALLVLNIALGDETGYFGLDIADKEVIKRINELQITGYPGLIGDKEYQKLILDGHFYQYGMKGSPIFSSDQPDFIHYEIVTSAGQSGSSVYYYDQERGGYFVVGVHVLGRVDSSYNSATWLTLERFQQIQKWMRENSEGNEERVDLRKRGLRQSDTEMKFISIMGEFQKSLVTQLKISKHNIDCFMTAIISQNTTWSSLEEINLSGNQIKDEGARLLGTGSKWENLKKLDLSQNFIGDEAAAVIGGNKNWRMLEELLLSQNKIGDKGTKIIATSSSFPRLKILSLAGNRINEEGAISIGQNSFWKELRILNLSMNKIGDKGGIAIGKNTFWTKLEELWLNLDLLGDEAVKLMAKNPSWPNLTFLSLTQNLITDQGVAAIAKNKTWINLKILNLDYNSINDKGLSALGENQSWKNLVKLSVNSLYFGFKGMKNLCENREWLKLQVLNLQDNYLDSRSVGLLSFKSAWNGIKILILKNNQMKDEGAGFLSQNKTWSGLQTLDLEGNEIGDKGVGYLSQNESWISLKTLILGSNSIGDNGAKYLSDNHCWKCLETLDLRSNSISEDGAWWLTHNQTWLGIKVLSLTDNPVNSQAVDLPSRGDISTSSKGEIDNPSSHQLGSYNDDYYEENDVVSDYSQ